MVHGTRFLCRIKPDDLGKHLKRQFIDRLRIFVSSGTGGYGNAKYGGIGGDGGNIVIKSKSNISLRDVYTKNLKKRYVSSNGENSKKIKPYGKSGEDLVIEVPCGITAVTDSNLILGEVNAENETLIIAKGGRGGSPLNDYKREEGQKYSVNLDLKLIADVGLVGFPNAGKSTLLALVSRARPKIADYPFTTINPQLGVIEYDDNRRITVADLPGLIEGAHFNRGMGHKFLKHVSRTKLNLFLIDINGFQLNANYQSRSAFETTVFLNKELEMYKKELISKPSILVLNKMDTEGANSKYEEFMRLYQDYDKSLESIDEYWRPTERIKYNSIFSVSTKTNLNVEELCLEIREMIDEVSELKETKRREDEKNNQTEDNPTKLI